jgi:hypothetical protein
MLSNKAVAQLAGLGPLARDRGKTHGGRCGADDDNCVRCCLAWWRVITRILLHSRSA